MSDDQNLLEEIRCMDGEALTRAFDLYAPAIYKYAYRHCSSALLADQTVGEVFARLLEQLARGRGPASNLRAYLFEIAHHSLVDEIRHARRVQPLRAAGPALQTAGDLEITHEQGQVLDIIRRAMQQDLTDDQRHVIILRFLEGFSLRETACILGRNVGHVKVLQQRALAALRRAVERRAALPQRSSPRPSREPATDLQPAAPS